MQCPRCAVANPDDHRFCHHCGAPLRVLCPGCGTPSPGGSSFCGQCGARLVPREEPDVKALPGERRQVTVLFADLSGFTQLTRELGDEATHAVVEAFFALAEGVIGRFGGTVDKRIGDCVMALFGAPVAHGNDAERALHAALEIRTRMPELGREVGRDLGVHVGVAAGQVVARAADGSGHRDFTIIGDSVNLASRLTDAARSGDILVAGDVRDALVSRFDFADAGMLTVKGFVHPVPVARLLGVGSGVGGRVVHALVGRRRELRQLQGALAACRESGTGQTLYIRGEAGIGKTRLVEELERDAAAAGFACHEALVLDFGTGVGQSPISALVRSLIGAGPDPEAAAGAVARAEANGWFDPDRRVFVNDLADLPQPIELRALFDAMDRASRLQGARDTLATLVCAASREQPRLVVVEDVHWADPATLDHVATLCEAADDLPAILVVTSRLEGDPLDQAWRSRIGGSAFTTLDLGPLRPEDARALASAYLDAAGAYAEHCIARAAGNPLFLEQLLRHAEAGPASAVPGSIQSLVQARMDALPRRDREAVQVASVFGQRFSLEALRDLLGQPDYDLAQPVGHFLLRPHGAEFLFAHALVRDAVYATLLGSRRRELHARAAGWFATRDPILYAEHLDRAADPRAVAAYLAAARTQLGEFRFDAALQLVERGLALARTPADQAALACLRGEILHDLGVMTDSMAAYEDALAAAADDAQRCRAWIGLAAGLRTTDQYQRAFAALDEAEELAAAGGLTAEIARLHSLRGNLCFALSDIDGCLCGHEAALTHARKAGSIELEAQALNGLGDAEYARGRMLSARARFLECIALCREHGFGRIEVASLPMASICRIYEGDMHGALDEALAAIAAAQRVGHRRAEAIARHAAHFATFFRADLDAARMHLGAALELARRLGSKRFEAEALIFESEILRTEGRRAEAMAVARDALAISRATDMNFMGPAILASLALTVDDGAERNALLAEGEALLGTAKLSHNVFFFRRDAIDAALADGEWDEALRHADALETYTRDEPLPWSDFFIARGRVLAAAAVGGGARDASLHVELQRLCSEAGRLGLVLWRPRLQAALDIFGAAPAA